MKEETRPWGSAWAVARWLAAALVVALALWPLLARADAVSVVPVGRAVGIKLYSDGVVVVGTADIDTSQGPVNPARECGLREGDVITVIESDARVDEATIQNLMGVQDVLRVISMPKF